MFQRTLVGLFEEVGGFFSLRVVGRLGHQIGVVLAYDGLLDSGLGLLASLLLLLGSCTRSLNLRLRVTFG